MTSYRELQARVEKAEALIKELFGSFEEARAKDLALRIATYQATGEEVVAELQRRYIPLREKIIREAIPHALALLQGDYNYGPMQPTLFWYVGQLAGSPPDGRGLGIAQGTRRGCLSPAWGVSHSQRDHYEEYSEGILAFWILEVEGDQIRAEANRRAAELLESGTRNDNVPGQNRSRAAT
jgi:hypothetical protein